MKTLTAFMAFVFLFSSGVRADYITFTSSGTISAPSVYGSVEVHNNGTVLQLLGGTIGLLNAYDASRVEMSGGTITQGAGFIGTSSFLMTGGVINSYLVSTGTGTMDINGGTINNADYIKGTWSILNIRGGTINLYQGIFDEGYGSVNIYGYNFVLDPSHYLISGNLADGNPFAFKMNSVTYGKTNLIVTPEPLSLGLLAVGGLFLRRNFRK